MSKDLNLNFLSNLNYVLVNLEKNVNEVNNLEEKIYLEISKSEIVNYLNDVYLEIRNWKKNYEEKDFDAIINKYKKVESIISQLEVCLADYEDKFHMDGISYSIYQIGKILIEIKKESDKNARQQTNN